MTVRKLITVMGYEVDEAEMSRAEQQTKGFKGRIKNLALGAVAAIGAIGLAAIAAASDMEMLETQFEVMLGSAEKASAMMDELKDFAAATPFALEDLSKGTQNLLSFGVAEEKVIETMRMLGDTAGGNAEKLNSLILAYGKVTTKGRVSMEELNMIAERGIPIYDVLSKNLGVTREEMLKMVSAGTISAQDMTDAFQTMTSEGGMFFQGMERQSQTFAGVMSTMKDNVKLMLAAIGSELLPIASKLILMITELVQGPLGDLVTALVSGLGPVLETVSKLLEKVFTAVAPLSSILTSLFSIITRVLGVVSALFPVLEPVFAILQMVADVLSILSPVLGTLIDIVVEFGQIFGEVFSSAIMDLLDAMIPAILDLAEIVSMILEIFMPIIRVVLQFYMLFIRIKIFFKSVLFKIIWGVLRGILAGLKPIIEILRDQLAPIIKWVTDLFEKWGLTGGDWLTKLTNFIDKVANGIAKAIEWIFKLLAVFMKFRMSVFEIFEFIAGAIRALFEDGIIGFVTYTFDMIKDKFSAVIDFLNKIPGIDIDNPQSMEEGLAQREMDRQVQQNQSNTNISMQTDVAVNMPPGSGGDLSDPAAAGAAMQVAARAAFTLELKKLVVEAGL